MVLCKVRGLVPQSWYRSDWGVRGGESPCPGPGPPLGSSPLSATPCSRGPISLPAPALGAH